MAPLDDALLKAVARGDLDDVRWLLTTEGANVNGTNESFNSVPLHRAAYDGNAEMTRLLLDYGADANARDRRGGTALHKRCLRGSMDMQDGIVEGIFRGLLENGADINCRTEDGRTPLHIASSFSPDYGLIRFLLKSGADVTIRDHHGDSALDNARRTNEDRIIVDALVSHIRQEKDRVQAMLHMHEMFVEDTVLMGIYDPDSPSSILNQGDDDDTGFIMNLIADFCGVPTGEALHRLRDKLENLCLLLDPRPVHSITLRETTYSLSAKEFRYSNANALIRSWRQWIASQPEGAKLEAVDLSHFPCSVEAAELIAAFLRPLAHTVVHAKLNDVIRRQENGLRVLTTLCDIFEDANNLRSVVLNNNPMGNEGILACRTVLAKPSLLSLELESCGLSDESMRILSENLRGNIEALYLKDNAMEHTGTVHAATIFRNCPNLKDVKFAYCSDGSVHLLQALCGERESLDLLKLDIGNSHLVDVEEENEDNMLMPFSEVLHKSPNLHHLSIQGCKLTTNILKKVGEIVIGANIKLTFLDVSDNDLSGEAGKTLKEILIANRLTLKVLNADFCYLTSVAVEFLVEACDGDDNDDTALECLELTCNELGHRAAVALTEATLPNLKVIQLDHNGFDIPDVERLEEFFGDKLVVMEYNKKPVMGHIHHINEEADYDALYIEEEEAPDEED